jgi:hypothetical protein
MKNKRLAILAAVILTLIVSMACSLFSRTPAGPLIFKPDTLPDAQIDVSYETEIQVTQNKTPVGEFSISKGALPAGLELIKVVGKDQAKISGIPTEAGTFTFTVSVWCYGTNVSGQTGEKEYSIVVP